MGLAIAGALAALPADAHGTGATREPPKLSELPDSPVKQALLDTEGKRKKASLPESLLREPMREARHALERARGAEASGDTAHAPLLVRLGRRWGKVAAALVRAASKESALTTDAKRLEELETKVNRAETLLSEQQARLGRLRAQLEQLDKEHADKRAKAPGLEPPLGRGPGSTDKGGSK